MDKKSQRSIVPVADIPLATDAPTDDLITLFKTFAELTRICLANNGIGLSASQIGIPLKLFVVVPQIMTSPAEVECYVNCSYEGIGDKKKSIEGCLSLIDDQGSLRRFEVDRFVRIRLTGHQLVVTDSGLNLIPVNEPVCGLYATVFQHEIDHDHGRKKMIDVIGQEIDLF